MKLRAGQIYTYKYDKTPRLLARQNNAHKFCLVNLDTGLTNSSNHDFIVQAIETGLYKFSSSSVKDYYAPINNK